MSEIGLGACVSFLVGGSVACTLMGEAIYCHSCGQVYVKVCVLGGVCELCMILDSLSVDGSGCVPILLFVHLEESSTEDCRLLGGTEDLLKNSQKLIFTAAGNLLVVQKPGLSISSTEAQV